MLGRINQVGVCVCVWGGGSENYLFCCILPCLGAKNLDTFISIIMLLISFTRKLTSVLKLAY